MTAELARPSRVMPLPTDDEPTIARLAPPEDLVTQPPSPMPSPPATLPGADRPGSDAPTRALAPAGPPCEMCGVPAGGRRFCADCDPSAESPTQIAPLQPVGPDPEHAAPARRRRRFGFIAALFVLVLAGAGTALALRDDSEPERVAGSLARPAGTTAPASVDQSAPGSQATTTAPPGESSTATTTTPTGGASPATTSADEGGAGTGAAQDAADTGPEKALREHWTAIGSGDFAAAFAGFSSRYRNGREYEDWSRGIRGFSPDVEIVEIEQLARIRDRARVRLILATRDRGERGNASRCHIFRGRVGVVREHGRWLYDPPGLREKVKGGIDPSQDPRCDPLF